MCAFVVVGVKIVCKREQNIMVMGVEGGSRNDEERRDSGGGTRLTAEPEAIAILVQNRIRLAQAITCRPPPVKSALPLARNGHAPFWLISDYT